MARRLRFVPPGGAVMEVMTRTFQRRFLLRPTPEVTEIVLGILGRAQARYQMTIYSFVFLSDHYHMQLRAKSARQLSRFIGYVNSNIAREVGKIVGWQGAFWDRRYFSMVVSDEEAILLERFKYIISNGCKEGLVASPLDWTGASVATALRQGVWVLKGKWYDRTKQYRASVNGKRRVFESSQAVQISPLPCWDHLSHEEIRKRIVDIIREIEDEAAHMHRVKRTVPVGMARVLHRRPHDSPKTESKSSPAPLFLGATREARQLLRDAYNAFVSQYRHAAERLKAGELNVNFPIGSFPPPRPFVEAFAPG
jgi:putative transposase